MSVVVKNKKTNISTYQKAGRILIVDDDIDFADGLADVLRISNFEVNITGSIIETLALVDKYKPDIALIDLKLGADNGIDLIRQLKQKWNPDLICIVITACADIDTAMNAISEGADNYLQKPIRKDTLLAELKRSYDKILLKKEKDSIYLQLKKSEKQLTEAQRIAHLGSWEHDLVNDEMIWSVGLYNIFEIDPDSSGASYNYFLDFIHTEDQGYVKGTYIDAINNLLPYEIEHRILVNDGRLKFVRQQCEISCDSTGKAVRSFGTVLDITDRKMEELTLQNIAKSFSVTSGEEYFQALTKHIGDTLNFDYVIVGSLIDAKADIIRTVAVYNCGQFLEPLEYRLKDSPCNNVVGKRSKGYLSGVQKQFPDFSLLVDLNIESYVGSPLFDSNGNSLGVIVVLNKKPIQNIKRIEALIQIYANRAAAELERLRYEKNLSLNEEKFRSFIEYGPDGILIINPEGEIDIVNRQLEIMTGYQRKTLIGKTIDILIPRRFKYHGELMQKYYHTPHVQYMAINKKIFIKCKDGKELPVEINLIPLDTENGLYVSVEIHDISGRIKAEQMRKELEEELFRSQKLEAIGQLTGGIAHDFNNILTSILGYVRLALRQIDQTGNEKLTEYLEQIKHGGERACDLVKQMLAYSRNMPDKIVVLDLQPIIINTLKLLRPTLPKTINIKFIQAESSLFVKLDAVQFEQMFMNLCINARDTMEGNGQIDIALECISIDSLICDSCHKSFSGDYIGLSIEDTGAGISTEMIQRIFDPFFSTKDSAKSSGLGLSMVHGAMHSVDGHILVDSVPGEGTTIRLVFPVVSEGKQKYAPSIAKNNGQFKFHKTGKGSIVVIDDEPAVANYIKELLVETGYKTEVFNDGDSALFYIEQNENNIDLVITDQTMKGISGLDMSGKILSKRSDLPIIIMTGYNDQLDKSIAEKAGIKNFLRKPVDEVALLNNIRKLIPSKEDN